MTVAGTLNAANVNSTSDVRLKKNITTIENGLEKITSMRGTEYDRIDFDNKHEIGLIAQEVESIAPELVTTDERGMKSISYGKVVAILIEAVKNSILRLKS